MDEAFGGQRCNGFPLTMSTTRARVTSQLCHDMLRIKADNVAG
jgi:hypothetical protein